jgi:hypothetical protein
VRRSRTATILAVAVGALLVVVGSTAASPRSSAPQLGDAQSRHTLTLKRATRGASTVARWSCNQIKDCIYREVSSCSRRTKHNWICQITVVRGTPGDQTLQAVCRRDVWIFITRTDGLFWHYDWVAPYACFPNTEYPGL